MRANPLRLLALSAVVAMALGPAPGAAGQTAADKTIFLSVLNEGGKPVTDITLGEILIREDGVDREVVSVSRATQPLYVALLVDTTPAAEPYIRDIRNGLAAFARQVRAASPDARISVTEFGQAAVPITPFTTDGEKLEKDVAARHRPERPEEGRPLDISVTLRTKEESVTQEERTVNTRTA